MRAVGLHIRVTHTLVEVFEKAIRLQLPFFQCFFIQQDTHRMINISQKEMQLLRLIRSNYPGDVYLHGSYYSNLAHTTWTSHHILEKELHMAELLGFNYVVLHAGYTKASEHRSDGIDAIARVLNKLFIKRDRGVSIIMENSAHAGMTIGSDFTDFRLLLEKIDIPERISFCVDTAHAHAFGYDIMTTTGQISFIQLLQETIGLNTISLIHLNDTKEPIGSYIDRHCIPGDGVIGRDMLRAFIQHEPFKQIRLLLELPVVEESEEHYIIDTIRSW